MRFLSNITLYSYSPAELRASIKSEDIWKFKIQEEEIANLTNESSEQFYGQDFKIGRLAATKLRGKAVYRPVDLHDTLTLRRTNEILRQSLRTSVLHRDDEIVQLLAVLRAEQHCEVFRTDVSSLFESIQLESVISSLENDGFRNQCTLSHLRDLNRYLLENYQFGGLPRGIGLSSTLADYVFRHFDTKMLTDDSVVYYARYVDDICLVHFNRPKVRELVETALPQPLVLNDDKTKHLAFGKSHMLKFLGYSLALDRHLNVGIADSKLARHKRRIVLSIQQYLRDQNFILLFQRLKFLTGNVRMKMLGRNVEIFSGIRHVYRQCTESVVKQQLKELDKFYHSILNSKRFHVSRRLRAALTPEQGQILARLSYYGAYLNNITYDMNHITIANVKRVWKYE